MHESTVTMRELEKRDNVSTPHMAVDGELTPLVPFDPWNVAPAMALNSSAIDMAQEGPASGRMGRGRLFASTAGGSVHHWHQPFHGGR